MADSSPETHSGTSGFLSPELLLAAVVDSSDDAILSKNLSGIITSWNFGAERIFGYSAAEMIGQSIMRLVPAGLISEEKSILERLRRGERIEHYETTRARKDGRVIDVSLTISPIRDATGTIVGASNIARNITEQKQFVSKLAEAHEALRRADRLKVEFISTLSHELRTPLNAIGGWLQILEGGASQEELVQAIEVIRRNIKAQAQLIDDLLDMSRIESGKLMLDMQRVDIAAIATAAIESVKPAAEAKEIRLSAAFSSVKGILMGDRTRLQQIVWNLLTNAIKFSNKGGRVHVSAHRINSHLELVVSDSGIGIPADFLDHIFERFKQVDSSTTRRHGGLGLGLSIVKHLVELHGGTIRATSEGVGKGAIFVVCFPLLSADVEHERVAEPSPTLELESNLELAEKKVLVVDDEADSREIVKRILERSGAQVRMAASVAEAMRELGAFQPDVLVSDIGMPDQDGYELIRRIRELPDGKKLPAVALTALARSEDRANALRAGFQMHVAKPVDGAELVAAIRNLALLRAG